MNIQELFWFVRLRWLPSKKIIFRSACGKMRRRSFGLLKEDRQEKGRERSYLKFNSLT